MASHSGILAWTTPWTEKSHGLQFMGSQRVGHDWVTNTHTHHLLIGSFSCWMSLFIHVSEPWEFFPNGSLEGLFLHLKTDIPGKGLEKCTAYHEGRGVSLNRCEYCSLKLKSERRPHLHLSPSLRKVVNSLLQIKNSSARRTTYNWQT